MLQCCQPLVVRAALMERAKPVMHPDPELSNPQFGQARLIVVRLIRATASRSLAPGLSVAARHLGLGPIPCL